MSPKWKAICKNLEIAALSIGLLIGFFVPIVFVLMSCLFLWMIYRTTKNKPK
jgi:hypothetical protein